ncbi:Mitotic-spindle organizing protein 1 [Golovinomyces cichoracearum]|uniref:Mitotic-spindle organizing protein 1 n=1 Tax=Golovinomyces cichoracearum TaxID=62708 RepID=A0A420HCT5_9PEZI|nr:Mitotic-spindle organizing protein 1 [Golovinomyces cichoracearum]
MPVEPGINQSKETNKVQARQVIDIFHEISTLLNVDLDRQTLSICISLIENGVNPEALAVSKSCHRICCSLVTNQTDTRVYSLWSRSYEKKGQSQTSK